MHFPQGNLQRRWTNSCIRDNETAWDRVFGTGKPGEATARDSKIFQRTLKWFKLAKQVLWEDFTRTLRDPWSGGLSAEVLEHAWVHSETRTVLFRLDPRTYKDRPNTWCQSHKSFGTWSWNSSGILEKWRIPLMDCHFQTNEQVCGRNVRRKERSRRSRRDGNRSRQNTRDNHILSPKCSYQLTNGSGMIFLPSITSVKDHCRVESRTLRQKCYDIMDHIEKMMGRLFGMPCYLGFAAISKIRIARRWSNEDWLNLLQKGSDKKRFFYCLNSDGLVIFLRVIQLYHVGCSRYLHSIMQSGVVAGGKDAANKGRQTVFFTALGTMNNEPEEEYQDLSKPRKIHCKGKWKIIQVAIYWVSLKKAQDNGLKNLTNPIPCHDLVRLCTSRLSWKSGTYQNWWWVPNVKRFCFGNLWKMPRRFNAMSNYSVVPASGNRRAM